MPFNLTFQPVAKSQLDDLEFDADKKDFKKLQKVRKCLGFIEKNPKHPGLGSHKYSELKGEKNEDVWESYVENNVATAWRVFWHYGPQNNEITIVAITPHP